MPRRRDDIIRKISYVSLGSVRSSSNLPQSSTIIKTNNRTWETAEEEHDELFKLNLLDHMKIKLWNDDLACNSLYSSDILTLSLTLDIFSCCANKSVYTVKGEADERKKVFHLHFITIRDTNFPHNIYPICENSSRVSFVSEVLKVSDEKDVKLN